MSYGANLLGSELIAFFFKEFGLALGVMQQVKGLTSMLGNSPFSHIVYVHALRHLLMASARQ